MIDASDLKVEISWRPELSGTRDKEKMSEFASHYDRNWKSYEVEFARIASAIVEGVWCAGTFSNGHRLNQNFKKASFIALDYDNEDHSLEEIIDALSHVPHIIGTTVSHQKEKKGVICDRMRALILLKEPAHTPAAYTNTIKNLQKNEMFAEFIDKNAQDAAHFFYPCIDIVDVVTTGYPLEINAEDPESEIMKEWEAYRDMEAARGIIPNNTLKILLYQHVPTGWRNSTCWRVAKDILRTGRDPYLAYDMITQSPTYRNVEIHKELRDEIWRCIMSAKRSLAREADKNERR